MTLSQMKEGDTLRASINDITKTNKDLEQILFAMTGGNCKNYSEATIMNDLQKGES